MDLREKIGPAVEVAEPRDNGQASPAAAYGPHDASAGASRTVNGHRRTLLSSPHPYPGRLIAVEGIDGSGKSTQLKLLERWLRARGYPVHFTEWNSSRLVRNSMRRGKRRNLLTPSTFSLLHAVDFADRFIYQILPPLRAWLIATYTPPSRAMSLAAWILTGCAESTALRHDQTSHFSFASPSTSRSSV